MRMRFPPPTTLGCENTPSASARITWPLVSADTVAHQLPAPSTVELIVESVPWHPATGRPRRCDEDIVAVRIAYGEIELRERARRLGAIWRPTQKLWEISWLDAKRLGIADRVASDT